MNTPEKIMSRTEAHRLVRELRGYASYVSNALDHGNRNDAATQQRIEEALNSVDGISAMLREALVSE